MNNKTIFSLKKKKKKKFLCVMVVFVVLSLNYADLNG